jgi:hypothetical protein
MGLDSDTPQTADNILDFIETAQIPLITINLLQALPRTPLYRRLEHVFPNRIKPPNSAARVNAANITMGMRLLANIIVRVGILSNYRVLFWKTARPLLRRGDLESLLHAAFVSYHLITVRSRGPAGQGECLVLLREVARSRRPAGLAQRQDMIAIRKRAG